MKALNPLTWFRWVGEFFQAYFLGIPWHHAPKAIPAVILSIVLFSTAFIAFSDGAGWRNRLLDKQLGISLERDDYETAEIILRRQLEADPENLALLHRFALIRDAQSHSEEAATLMGKLLDRRHLPSAKWLLQHELLGKKWTEFDDEQLAQAGQLLKLISESEPSNLAVKKMYAEYLILEQRYASAIPLLIQMSEVEPNLGLTAAALARRIGDEEGAARYAERALGRVEGMLKDDPTNASLALNIARNQIFLDRHSDAIGTLREALARAQTKEEKQLISQWLGDAIVEYIGYIEAAPTETIRQQLRVLKMLDVAVKIAPNNPRVVTMVADHVLSAMNEDDPELVSVREALVQGSSPGIAHFIKGTSALMKEDQQMAELHLEKAAEQMPRSAAIMNNLAVALAMREDPDFPRALEAANGAIDLAAAPTPHFFETRGQILFRMGRFREAISDLERALAVESLAPKAHEMLADCYEKVGDPDLAQAHRQAAQSPKREELPDALKGSDDNRGDDSPGQSVRSIGQDEGLDLPSATRPSVTGEQAGEAEESPVELSELGTGPLGNAPEPAATP